MEFFLVIKINIKDNTSETLSPVFSLKKIFLDYIVLGGGTLRHLQKFLQYFKYPPPPPLSFTC
jgi:hypothetical protein